jgi:hypothetical protein
MARVGVQLAAFGALALVLTAPRLALSEEIRAELRGFREVPSVSTPASGEFRGAISQDESAIEFELTFQGIQAPVRQAHIHLAQRSVNGGIIIFLCATNTTLPAVPPPGTQACPSAAGGSVSGTIHAGDVLAVTSQGIAPGELGEVIRAIRAGVTYANVHSDQSPGGEIRGQIKASRGAHGHD